MENKLLKWMELKEQLTQIKEEEMLLRRDIVNELFPVYKEGTNTLETHGFKVKFQCSLSRKVVAPNSTIEESVARGLIPEEVFKRTYSLDKRVYDKLQQSQKDFVESLIETKDNAPTLSIEKLEEE